MDETLHNRPLAIDLYCGLGGWTEGLLAEGYDVVGFDIERHDYGTGGYPAQLVLQDAMTLHGSQFMDAALIVASPPCQEFSYMAMPWSRGKQIRRALLGEDEFPSGYKGSRTKDELTALFDACFRIQREAIEAASHFIPLVVENVKGAQDWVGRSRWNYGSFHLYGDVPALMPITKRLALKGGDRNIGRATGEHKWDTEFKVPGFRFDGSGKSFQTASVEGVKGSDGYERDHPNALGWKKPGTSSHSPARKAASAAIAKIPRPLAQYIARVYYPKYAEC